MPKASGLRGLSLLFILLSSWSMSAQALRCDGNLVREGDYDFEVLDKCGEPARRDPIGYTLTWSQRREFLIERWVYEPKNGARAVLFFEGRVLKRIESRRVP